MSRTFDEVTSNPAAFRALLDEYGVAIVSGVLSLGECQQLESSWKAALLTLTKGDEAATEALVPGSNRTGFTPLNGLPHSEFSWQARMHPKVRQLFASIYETDELCVGIDLPFYLPKAGQGAPPDTTPAPHSDQNGHVPDTGSCSIWQGIVYVWDATDSTCSSTVVCPGSHKTLWPRLMDDPYAEKLAQRKDHFVRVQPMVNKANRNGILADFLKGARRAPVPAGGVLLWNSRVLHQGYTPGPRLAQPVVWEPKCRRTPVALVRKLEYTLRGYPTTHWAHLGDLHHVCWRFKGKLSKNAVGPTALTSPSSAGTEPLEERWLRSFAAQESIVIGDELDDLIGDAYNEADFGGHSSPSTERLLAVLRPDIAAAL